MKRILFLLITLLSLQTVAFGSTRFVYENFEDQNFLDTFVSTAESYCDTLNSANTVVSTAPYDGSYCMKYDGFAATNSRINIGEYSPYGGFGCGIFTEFTNNYTNDFVVRFRIKYASDFNWGSNCKKILRIKGSTYGTNGYFTWSQYGNYANIFLGNEAYSYDGIDLRYESYDPPENEWIEIYVHLRFSEDTILVKATDSGGEHVIYDGIYFDTDGAGYDAQNVSWITLVGARCGTSNGGQGDIYIDNIEIWDGAPDPGDVTPPEDVIPPGDITNFTAQAGDRQVALSWTNPTDSDFKGTMIRYSTGSDNYPQIHTEGTLVCNREAAPGSNDNFILTGLNNGTKYNFSAFTYDQDGYYSNAVHISATPSEADSDTTAPGYVTNFAAQTGDSQVLLNWTNPSDSDFKGTLIRYRTDGIYPTSYSEGIEVCNKTTPPGASDTYTLTGMSNGTTYYFSAFTYDEDGNYSRAAHISAMPSANVYTKTFGNISGSDFPGTCQDTYINKNDINYSDDSEAIRTYTWPTNSAANRIVMKWDLSGLPQDAIIQEAILSLYMYGFEETGGDDNYEITAHKIINHNSDILSCTWNTYDGSNSWTGGANGGEQDMAPIESSTIVDKTSGYKNWDITQMVQEWVDNSSTNFGLMLNADTTAASESNRYFRPTEYSNQDQRPVLTIKYSSSDISEDSIPSAPSGLGVSVSE